MTTDTVRPRSSVELGRMLIALTLVVIGGLAIMATLVSKLNKDLVNAAAINDARIIAGTLSEFRAIYSSEVVDRLATHDVEVSHDYDQKLGAIPLPATLSMQLGERLGRRVEGLSARMYSPWPFPWRSAAGGMQDEFSRNAWQTLNQSPQTPYSQVTTDQQGRTMVRFAVADVMQSSCVGCHNSHPDSPKRDWQIGQVRGVLEVSYPLTDVVAIFDESRQSLNTAVLVIALGLLLILGYMFTRLFKTTQMARQANSELTETLAVVNAQRDELVENRNLNDAHRQQLSQSNDELAQHMQELQDARLASLNMMQDMQEAQHLAEAGNYAKSAFLANMSHELRTPMNGVLGMLELVEAEGMQPEQQELLSTARASGRHLLKLLNDILDLSKVEAGELNLERLPVDVLALIEEVVAAVGEEAVTKGLEIGALCETPAGLVVQSDPTRLRQVITNLVGNAIKFTQQGCVLVKVARQEGCLLIRVIDTGIGIPEAAQAKIFEPFVQADDSTTRKFGGSGLGLTLSRRIVEALDGELTVSSQPHKGTTFVVRIPVETVQIDATEAAGVMPEHLRVYIDPELDGVLRDIASNAFTTIGASLFEARPSAGADVWQFHAAGNMLVMADPQGQTTRFRKPVTSARLRSAVQRLLSEDSGAAGSAPAPDFSRARILVVEDNLVNQKVVTGYLKRLQVQPVVVEDGEQALQAMAGDDFDLVLMDCHMPNMDGFAATREIRRIEAAGQAQPVPVIALTAGVLPEDVDACLDAGMDAHLAKPLRPQQLQACLQQWLNV